MSEKSCLELHKFLQANRKKPADWKITVGWCFSSNRMPVRFEGEIFIDVDARNGPHLVLLEHPENFNFDYHSGFNWRYDEITFDERLNQLTIAGTSQKPGIGRYSMIVRGRSVQTPE